MRLSPKESSLWGYIRDGMKSYWVCERIENIAGVGTPDLIFAVMSNEGTVFGFIELKSLEIFPKRESTKIKIGHFTEEQKLWFRKWGGKVPIWLFIRIENEYFLFERSSALHCEEWTREEWNAHSDGHWKGRVKWSELREILLKGALP